MSDTKQPDLTYVCTWSHPDPTRTWSGTSYALRQALGRRVDVQDIDTNGRAPFLDRVLWKLRELGQRLDGMDMSMHRIKLWHRTVNAHARGKRVLQFEEFCDRADGSAYLYIDLCVEWVWRTEATDPALSHMAMGKNDPGKLEERRKKQNGFMRHAGGVLCMGRWMQEYVRQHCDIDPDKVCHVGGGINVCDIEAVKPTEPRMRTKLLYVGRGWPRKGGPAILAAFRLLKQRMPQAELYVAGGDTDPVADPPEGYHFLGDISHEDVLRWMSRCDAFCMPSYFEPYGLVFIEALCMGLPCIGRDCYEMPYFIEDGVTGLLLRHEDPVELADLMERALTSEAMPREVASRREWYLREYSWDAVADRCLKAMRLA